MLNFYQFFKMTLLRFLGFTVSPSTLLSLSKHCFMKIFPEYYSTETILTHFLKAACNWIGTMCLTYVVKKSCLQSINKYTHADFHHFQRLEIFVNPKISKKVFHLLAVEWNFLPFENLQVLNKEVNQSLLMGLITWNLLRRVSILDCTRDEVEAFYYSCFLRMTVTEIPRCEIGTDGF